MDHWYAECAPCRWREAHDTQDDAIHAAEEHIAALHSRVSPLDRAKQCIGHVQNRTENASGFDYPKPQSESALPSPTLLPAASETSRPALSPADAEAIIEAGKHEAGL